MPDVDTRHTITPYFVLSTDEQTISRKGDLRVRDAFYTGTTDADASTTVNLVGIPPNVTIISAVGMINSSGTSSWAISGYREANSAASAFRSVVSEAAAVRTFIFSEVGSNFQGEAYRVYIKYVEKL